MTDAPLNPPLFGGQPGDPVPEVDPQDIKAVWREARDLQARHPGQNVFIGIEVIEKICRPGVNTRAIWFRMSMIWILDLVAPDRTSAWMKEGEPADTVFQTIATIPMEWIGHTEREGLPFDVDKFFRRLEDGRERRS